MKNPKRTCVICPLIDFNIQKWMTESKGLSSEEIESILKKREDELVKGIDLLAGVKVRRILEDELKELDSFPSAPSHGRLSSVKFVLEKHLQGNSEEFQKTRHVMHNIVLGLRLFKSGYFSGIFILAISEDGKSRGCYWEGGLRLHSYEPGYVLRFEEINSLIKLAEKVHAAGIETNRRLSLAVRRFQRSYEEDDFEDQMIDLMIAFETLFVRKESKGKKINQKIANGCSSLIGDSEREREHIKLDLLKAYKMRSHIVHGADYLGIEFDDATDDNEFTDLRRRGFCCPHTELSKKINKKTPQLNLCISEFIHRTSKNHKEIPNF